MATLPFRIRNMHKNYGRQLVYGRQLQFGRNLIKAQRLVRYREKLNDTPSPYYGPLAPERRKVMVEWVARELFENLMFTGGENPVLQDVQDELKKLYGMPIVFRYPPGAPGVSVFRQTEKGLEEADKEDKAAILLKVWDIIVKKVDETML